MNLRAMYSDPIQRNGTIFNLTAHGIRLFKDAHIVKHLEDVELILEVTDNLRGTGQRIPPIVLEMMITFSFEKMIDDIRITSCFENLIKANLMHKGFLVHIIESPQKIKATQRKEPIPIGQIEDLVLSDKTLNLSTMLNCQKYSTQIDFDKEIQSELKEISKSRNRIHFYNFPQLAITNENLEMLKRMKAYIEKINKTLQDIQKEQSQKE